MSDINKLPTRFHDLVANPPEGIQISERVIDPVVLISKDGGDLKPLLAGRRLVNGKERIILATDNCHDWVLDGLTARPLPSDIPEMMAGRFGAGSDGTWKRTLLKQGTGHDQVLDVRLSSELLRPGNAAAAGFPSTLAIPGLQAELYPYQAHGVAWMRDTAENFGGLVLADEMGLGKTLQILALLLLDPPLPASPALVVCPTSLIANWGREIIKFSPSLNVLVHRGPDRTGVFTGLQRTNIVITTYDTMVNDIALFSAFEWSWVICDEAQAIKNPESGRRRAIVTIPRKRTIAMTGTPVENSLLDLWSLTDFAIPGVLGSQGEFQQSYPDGIESAVALRKIIDPVMIKRRVTEVANDLPARIDIDVPIEMEDQLVDYYDLVREQTLQRYPIAGPLVATLQLQLVCAHPWLRVDAECETSAECAEVTERPGLPLFTSKMDVALRLIHEAFSSNRKVLVFSIFNRFFDLLQRAGSQLPSAWWGAINGSTPQTERQNVIDNFSSFDGAAILVLNPRAAGSGLNITAATVVIHMTPVWNPALEAQASARAHRRGQTMPVTVYRLYYDNTVERVMIDRAAWKNTMGNEIAPVATRDAEDYAAALAITPGRIK